MRTSRIELTKREREAKAAELLSPYDWVREPHVPPADADDQTVVLGFNELLPEMKCPICLSIISEATSTQECLHRFCAPCITRSLAVKKECPTCRVKVKTQRSLRKDPAFDMLVSIMYPDKDAFEQRQSEILRKVRENSNQEAMIQSFNDGLKKQDVARKQKHLVTPRSKGWEDARRAERARASQLLGQRPAKRVRTDVLGAPAAAAAAPDSRTELVMEPHPEDGESAIHLSRKYLEIPDDCTLGHLKKFLEKQLPKEDGGPPKGDVALYNLSVNVTGQGFVRLSNFDAPVASIFQGLSREDRQRKFILYYSSAAIALAAT
eukprot:CAMPEP_0182921104 /NCGR_PEP_ID=MMETSP0105_2-20130417/3928_1 /TAXON_ID=81532 ORGANISM="Acanthoeca-like sp., Strain 10tr" /NCGR_SAMPLE_ID=MMETSP0105_2 /ASSEMBLY_ACC=CAM_ASM_000205 /LENGTH=320 /DNA_ID=CAMNT_0025058589 /DNA_START=262 /DNA_END=1224 /DNA_ORIENTATION=+